LKLQHVSEAQFDYMEYRQEDFVSLSKEAQQENCGIIPVSGFEVKLDGLDAQGFFDAMVLTEQSGAAYLLLQTTGCRTKDTLYQILEDSAMAIADFEGEIYIENGFLGDDLHGYTYSTYSTSNDLLEVCRYGNRLVGKEVFKAALNVGYANLLEKNVRRMIDDLGTALGLIHVSDNDGRSNLRQMPYTFTTGRGVQSTDWKRILGAMMKIPFDGWLIFDTVGLFQRIPEDLQLPMLKLLKEIEKSWIRQYHFEDLICEPGKKIILFGAGAMAYNYIQVWGKKYPPAFLVDNNSKNWGLNLEGIEIKSPDAIKDVPPEERLVLICNLHYSEIKLQLANMGVRFECYNDEYYM
jgi:sugar phosphate isomerase/epimerase